VEFGGQGLVFGRHASVSEHRPSDKRKYLQRSALGGTLLTWGDVLLVAGASGLGPRALFLRGVSMRKVLFLAALLVGLTVAGPAWAAEDELVVTPQTFTVELGPGVDPSGNPIGDPDGSGTAELTVDLKAKTVCYDITVTNIGVPTEPIAGIGNAHIHSHPEGGAIAVDLDTQFAAVAGVENTYQAKECVKAKRGAVVDILLHPEDYYVNVHTVNFPGGAVQGDLA
jgi:hypothetical protein